MHKVAVATLTALALGGPVLIAPASAATPVAPAPQEAAMAEAFRQLAILGAKEQPASDEMSAQWKTAIFKSLIRGLRSSKADKVIDRIPHLDGKAKKDLKRHRHNIADELDRLEWALELEETFKEQAINALKPIVGGGSAYVIVEGLMFILF